MAVKTFCDRCGKELKPHALCRPNGKTYDFALEQTFYRWGWTRKSYELCYDCAMALREFLKNKE